LAFAKSLEVMLFSVSSELHQTFEFWEADEKVIQVLFVDAVNLCWFSINDLTTECIRIPKPEKITYISKVRA
jgi:hypothetical protein